MNFLLGNSFPFDCKTPIGYAVAMFSQTMDCLGTTVQMAYTLSTYILFCNYFVAIGSDVNESYRQWDNAIAAASADRIPTERAFIDIIELHVSAKMYPDIASKICFFFIFNK